MKIYLNISNDEDFSSSEVLHKPTWTNHNNQYNNINNKQIISKIKMLNWYKLEEILYAM